MMSDSLSVVLRTPDEEDIELLLWEWRPGHRAVYPQSSETSRVPVRSDLSYELHVAPPTGFTGARLYINDVPQNCRVFDDEDRVRFVANDNCDRFFENCFGNAQLALEVDLMDPASGAESTIMYTSRPLPVALAATDADTESMREMIEYVWGNEPELLFEGYMASRTAATLQSNGVTNLESTLHLARHILEEYKRAYPFFRSNARFTMQDVAEVQGFDRLRRIEADTLRYIVSHPEHLIPATSATGIQLGSRVFEPRKTLVMSGRPSADVYENRVVVGFLDVLVHALSQARARLDNTLTLEPGPNELREGYVSLADALVKFPRHALRRMQREADALVQQAEDMQRMYASVMKVSPDPQAHCPRPTSTFFRVDEYNRIFQLIHRWKEHGMGEIDEGPLLFATTRTPDIYEHYLTLRIREHFLNDGWTLKRDDRQRYPIPNSDDPHYGRILVFEYQGYTLRMFVQPVIYSGDIDVTGSECGLYRNNSLGIGYGPGQWMRTSYYTPDYVFSLVGNGEEKYMMADAKFRLPSSVERDAADLIFRYLVSITPRRPSATLSGLTIFCGRGNKTPGVHSFYNLARKESEPRPRANWVNISERDSDDERRVKLSKVFDDFLFGVKDTAADGNNVL